MYRFLSFLLASTFLLGSCKNLKPFVKPEEAYTPLPNKPTTSTITIPLSIQQKTLLDKINKQVDGLLYADTSFAGDNLMLKVWKTQPISLSINNNVISYRVPLKIWVNTGISKWGITIQKDIQLTLALKYLTHFAIQSDWSVQSTTVSDGYEWLNNPYITIAGIQIPVKSLAERIINGLQPKISPEIDKLITQNISIRKYAEELWTQLQKPLLLNDDYHLWLKLQPTQVFMTPLMGNNNVIAASLGMEAVSEIYFSKQTPVVGEFGPLPPFKMPTHVANNLRINMGIDIPYSEAEQLAGEHLVGKTFSSGKKQVIVKSLNIYGSKGKVVLEALLAGSYNGKVYLTGIPVYNAEKQNIELSQLDFSIETHNLLLKSAGWLFHSDIVNKIAENAKFPVGAYFESAKVTANKNLDHVTVLKNIVLKGTITRIDVAGISLTPKSFRVLGLAEGNLEAEVLGLDF